MHVRLTHGSLNRSYRRLWVEQYSNWALLLVSGPSNLIFWYLDFLINTNQYICRPQGLGSMTIGLFGGRFQDWYFRRIKRKLNFQPKHPRDLDGFPIERVRFAMVPYYIPIWAAACIGYGFMLEKRVYLAGPLVVSFLIGAGTQFSSQTCQLILVDFFPTNAGASSATVSFSTLRSPTFALHLSRLVL